MRRDSIQRRLITTVVLSQAILTAGLVITGVVVTYWRLLSTLDSGMQAHTMSVAALVRYSEDASGNVYFDNSLLPESIDPNHPDQFMVWADRTGLLTHSEDWPDGLHVSARSQPALEFHLRRRALSRVAHPRTCPSWIAKRARDFVRRP